MLMVWCYHWSWEHHCRVKGACRARKLKKNCLKWSKRELRKPWSDTDVQRKAGIGGDLFPNPHRHGSVLGTCGHQTVREHRIGTRETNQLNLEGLYRIVRNIWHHCASAASSCYYPRRRQWRGTVFTFVCLCVCLFVRTISQKPI